MSDEKSEPEATPPPAAAASAPAADGDTPLKRLITRVKAIIITPTAEWEKIDLEKSTAQTLLRDYLAPLVAIPAVAILLHALVSAQDNPFHALFGAIIFYALSIVGVFLVGEVIFQLSDNFSARQDRIKAMKAAVYSSTPVWLAGIVFIAPAFDFFFVLSLWALFILYRGLAVLMKPPADKLMGYETVVIAVAVVMAIVLITIGAVLTGHGSAQ
jgi:hypothetical protein